MAILFRNGNKAYHEVNCPSRPKGAKEWAWAMPKTLADVVAETYGKSHMVQPCMRCIPDALRAFYRARWQVEVVERVIRLFASEVKEEPR